MSALGEPIDIDDARAGMILACDLSDAHGTVLLPGGASLTDATLSSLRRRGIASVSVLMAAAPPDSAALAAERARCRLRLDRLFRHSGTEQAGPALLQLLLDYRQHGTP
ncbi:MAG: hypothetical protein V4754_04945 [Pseudomonadota bacterium]